MKKNYVSPELEVVRFTLTDVLSGSPTDSAPAQGNEPVLPGNDATELPGDLP